MAALRLPTTLLILLVALCLLAPAAEAKGKRKKAGKKRAKKKRAADIHRACESDDPEMIQAALDAGADINKKGKDGQTPLMFSVLQGYAESVRFLLDKGADPTIGEYQGYTPMHGAAFQGRAEIAQMLIDHGLDPHDLHKDGFRPFHRALWGMEQRHTEAAEVFIKAGADLTSPGGPPNPEDGPPTQAKPLAMAQNPETQKLLKRYLKQSKISEKLEDTKQGGKEEL